MRHQSLNACLYGENHNCLNDPQSLPMRLHKKRVIQVLPVITLTYSTKSKAVQAQDHKVFYTNKIDRVVAKLRLSFRQKDI